ncbi:GNAT family N-acetyltransferase [Streptomyces sp. NBC_01498]|uniref:GNAT family N-acetyltransferase n=1 Tax=Streptomyces sp. NBC_01498 TaxID=2975870 RepID=UPI002E7C4077|nr:GNAT family N-acetyltransferase [Streptomyces sp. NBC_01498]WTL23841.1 GNAT family N-acetyltransferase [Streptomyces sp. NBC_01498]
MAFIRSYRPGDRAAVFDICVRTADAGGDSRHLYPDSELVPSVFAAPYLELEPDLAFVLDDGEGRAVGYILGVADTPRFAEAYRRDWLPVVGDRFPAPGDDVKDPTPSQIMAAMLHDPERMVLPELAGHPAHLHIDLLPDRQGQGHGRALIHTLLDALSARGVEGIHLSMLPANTGARAFYDRVGFHEITVPGSDPDDVTFLVRGTAR